MTNMITLLLVDDEPLIRQGLHTLLERVGDIRVIGEASNGADAITLAQALHPDVVLMDISMPAPDGIAATAALHASVPQCAVVLLSLSDDASLRARVMRPCEHEHLQPERQLWLGNRKGPGLCWPRYAKQEGRDACLIRSEMAEHERCFGRRVMEHASNHKKTMYPRVTL